MNRFFGLMPTDKIEISKDYIDDEGQVTHIEAGREGWTILWHDHSTTYADELDTAENNFKKAFNEACKLSESFRNSRSIPNMMIP